MKNCVALVSGGLESLVTAALMRKEKGNRYGLFVDYGQTAREKELRAAHAIAREYGMYLEVVQMDLPFLKEHDLLSPGVIFSNHLAKLLKVKEIDQAVANRAHVIPYRNLMFLSIAASFASTAGVREIWAGFDYVHGLLMGTRDKSPLFVNAFNQAVGEATDLGGNCPVVVTPLQGKRKFETVLLGSRLGVNWGLSWSCYNDLDLPCGVCAQCIARKDAFLEAEVAEGVEYHSLPYIKDLVAH